LNNKNRVLYIIMSIIAIIFPIGYLFGIISAKVALPVTSILLGCQQLFHGLFVAPRDNKPLRFTSSIFGILFILFGVFVLLPNFYS